ncbi:putative preprotein translocase SecG subunit [Clostridium aceticum]|uniref:Protein-export membrane protein SecG n=1 Tax=Clostridium aceticum TaxID=84022 RepID=A0A0D8I5N2_9CLOT|nr:preprotein translocase subunit SecG [Clostridium aceticum]AKL94705.1 putative preprotein translocase SecG subunit [Clostridium aceticum]KJF25558.1 preprotein translocase subunit SecG [Clostridium aceticum]
MRIVLMVLQLITSLVLIGSILLQSGKSAGLSGSISGGAEQLWGKQSRGYEGMLSKVTAIGAALFIIVAILLVAIQ